MSKFTAHLVRSHPKHVTQTSPSPRLPPELVLYTLLTSFSPQIEEYAESRDEARQALCNVALVCRSWYSIVIRLLYSNIPLFNHRAIHLFARTLKASPTLPKLVKRLSLIDDQETSSPTLLRYSLNPRSNASQKATETISSIIRILRSCENLESLSATFTRPVELYIGLKNPLSGPTWLTSRLRKLTLTGNTLEVMLTHFALPLLEVLCLRVFNFSQHIQFHPLPRVHTLRLYQPLKGEAHPFITSLRNLFPALRTYDLLKEGSSSPMADVGALDHIQGLEELSFVECPRAHKFDQWRVCETLQNIRSFILGVIDDNNGTSLASWHVPPLLESLVILVGVPFGGISYTVPPLEFVLQFLRFNARLRPSCSLHKVEIKLRTSRSFDVDLPDDYQMLITDIASFSESWGVELSVDRVREYRLLCRRLAIHAHELSLRFFNLDFPETSKGPLR